MELKEMLTALLDKYDLAEILTTMADICFEKASYIRMYERDKRQAPLLRRIGKTIQRAHTKIILYTKD